MLSRNYTQRDISVKLPLSIQTVMRHEIPRSIVAHSIAKYFTVSPEIQYNCLDTYFTRVWTAAVTLAKIGSAARVGAMPGTIYDSISATAYTVIYKDLIRHTLLENPEMELFLSFRKAHPLYDLPAYVIVKRKGQGSAQGSAQGNEQKGGEYHAI